MGPALSVLGISKSHAERAIRHMRRFSLLAFYRPEDRSLNTWELKAGVEATYAALNKAIEATRK